MQMQRAASVCACQQKKKGQKPTRLRGIEEEERVQMDCGWSCRVITFLCRDLLTLCILKRGNFGGLTLGDSEAQSLGLVTKITGQFSSSVTCILTGENSQTRL